MSVPESLYWLGLSRVPGIGPKRFLEIWQLLQAADLPVSSLWSMSELELKQRFNLPLHLSEAFLDTKKTLDLASIQHDLQIKRISLLIYTDPHYPALLKHISDPPMVLYAKGDVNKMSDYIVAVVGTRKITPYGKSVTEFFTKGLIAAGYTIISGFMYGVDSIGHQTTLDAGGLAIGVLGYGFDHLYPNNLTMRKMFDRTLAQGGIFLTEHAPADIPIPGNFPRRNRIVAGMSRGVLVTEAAVNSGSKITALLASEYGREVFAVPGPITSPYSEGTKDLINQGAKLVTKVEDILVEFGHQSNSDDNNSAAQVLAAMNLNEMQRTILDALAIQGQEVDELLDSLKIPTNQLLTELTQLEILGLIWQEGGKYTKKL